MRTQQLALALVYLGCTTLLVPTPVAASQPSTANTEEDGSSLLDALYLRLAADIGGIYKSNIYANSSHIGDLIGLAQLQLNSEFFPTNRLILKLGYLGELNLHKEEQKEHHYQHQLNATAGFRPVATLYLFLLGGFDHAHFPANEVYTFFGPFAKTGARWEIGEESTMHGAVRARYDQFPDYNLDNISVQTQLRWDRVGFEYLEFMFPVSHELRYYLERELLDEKGQATTEPRMNHHLMAQPKVVFLPSYGLHFGLEFTGEYLYSNDTYYYVGPFGKTDPTADPSLIAHFDSYYGVGSRLEAQWYLLDDLVADLGLAAGLRGFTDRPAYQTDGTASTELEQDFWLLPSVALQWRLLDCIQLRARYSYLKQWSNDVLWDFDAHRVDVTVGTWWQSE